jgi:hypothetical protein
LLLAKGIILNQIFGWGIYNVSSGEAFVCLKCQLALDLWDIKAIFQS